MTMNNDTNEQEMHRAQLHARNLFDLREKPHASREFYAVIREYRMLSSKGDEFASNVMIEYHRLVAEQYKRNIAKRTMHAFNYGKAIPGIESMCSKAMTDMNPPKDPYKITVHYKKRNTYTKKHDLSAYWNVPGKGYTYIPDMDTKTLIECSYWIRDRVVERAQQVTNALLHKPEYADRVISIIEHLDINSWSPSWRHLRAELTRRNLQSIIDEIESKSARD